MSGPAPSYLFLEPIEVETGVNDGIRFKDSGGFFSVAIAAGTYFLLGDGSVDDIVQAITDAINASGSDTTTATTAFGSLDVDSLGIGDERGIEVIFSSSGASFRLLFADVDTTFDVSKIGFLASTDLVDGTGRTSEIAPSSAWVPDDAPRVDDPTEELDGSQDRLKTSAIVGVERTGSFLGRDMAWERLQGRRVLDELTDADAGATFETFRRRVLSYRTFRLYTAKANSGDVVRLDLDGAELRALGVYVLHQETAHGRFRPARDDEGRNEHDFPVRLKKVADFEIPTDVAIPEVASLVLDYDADDPGASNRPHDRGTEGLGEMNAIGTPTFQAAGGPSGGGAWYSDGGGDAYTQSTPDGWIATSPAELTAAVLFKIGAWGLADGVVRDLYANDDNQQGGGSAIRMRAHETGGTMRFQQHSTGVLAALNTGLADNLGQWWAYILSGSPANTRGKHSVYRLGETAPLVTAQNLANAPGIGIGREQWMFGWGGGTSLFEVWQNRALVWNVEIEDHGRVMEYLNWRYQ